MPNQQNPFLEPTPVVPEEQLPEANPISEQMQTKPSVEITNTHKENFFRAFLADRPYEEEISLLGGNFRVVFCAITMEQNADLLKQIAMDREKGRIDSANDYYFRRVADYRLSLAIKAINDQEFLPELVKNKVKTDTEAGTSYVSARADVLGSWTMAKVAAIQAAMSEFDQRNIALVDAVSKPDFWKAAA